VRQQKIVLFEHIRSITTTPPEASEWELRERRENEEEGRQEAEGLGAEVGEELLLFLPTPSFTLGAVGRYWTSSPPQTWEGGCRPRRMTP